jgi:thymidylate synthase
MSTINLGYVGATGAWAAWLHDLTEHGQLRSPRGMATLELPHLSTSFDLHYPVIDSVERKLSYKFLSGEALWILNGDDRVETIRRYNRKIADFSDDGITFFGAYGPLFVQQLTHVTRKLIDDADTRQAVITLWRPSPPPTRDVPCTVALQFVLRSGALDAHVFMRSSDAWLGVPYDWFNFTMMALRVAHTVNYYHGQTLVHDLGRLYFTAGCAHVYVSDLEGVNRCLTELDEAVTDSAVARRIEPWIVRTGDAALVDAILERARDDELPPTFPYD